MAFIGGLIHIDASVYKKLLGILLFIPIVRFLFFKNIEVEKIKPSKIPVSLFLGAVIGLFSGMIGIGGGIILSPVLLLLCWTDQNQSAAISALFILMNSVSGLAGQLTQVVTLRPDMCTYVDIAFSGGLLGPYLGAIKFPQNILKNILSIVLALAAY